LNSPISEWYSNATYSYAERPPNIICTLKWFTGRIDALNPDWKCRLEMSSPQPYQQSQFNGQYNYQNVIVTVASAISLYNAIELILLIFTTFREWRGLYFWSLLIATFGIIPYCVGFIAEFFTGAPKAIGMSIDSIGWVLLISGQSFVLYSRLHLVLNSPRILKTVKWMIIIDAIVLHTTTTVLLFGANYGGQQAHFKVGYKWIEKIQMTMFCIQEFILSGLYIWNTLQILKVTSKKGTRRVMWQLFTINIIIIVLDIGLLAIEYRNYHVLEQTFKSFIYSVKLKLEFAILGKLIELAQSSKRSLSNALLDADTYVDSRNTSDLTKLSSAQKLVAPRPKWMEDLEKSVVEHHEDIRIVPTDPNNEKVLPARTGDIESMPIQPQSAVSRRWTQTDSDLIYAEAMRELSR
jgi:hypothetical protein